MLWAYRVGVDAIVSTVQGKHFDFSATEVFGSVLSSVSLGISTTLPSLRALLLLHHVL